MFYKEYNHWSDAKVPKTKFVRYHNSFFWAYKPYNQIREGVPTNFPDIILASKDY